MAKILVLPDIHGRTFWKKPCENLSTYDRSAGKPTNSFVGVVRLIINDTGREIEIKA